MGKVSERVPRVPRLVCRGDSLVRYPEEMIEAMSLHDALLRQLMEVYGMYTSLAS